MLATLIVVLHVLSVFWLVAGILGRDACSWHIARARDLNSLKPLASLSNSFELTAVRPATFVVLITGLLAAYLRGYPVLGFNRGGGGYWVHAALLAYLSIIPVIAFVFVPKGRVYHAALADAEERGEVTEALRKALADPAAKAARAYELGMIVVLTYLMVVRPF